MSSIEYLFINIDRQRVKMRDGHIKWQTHIYSNIIQKISILEYFTLSNSSMQHIPLSASINAPASTQNSPKLKISRIIRNSVNFGEID